MLPQLFGRSAGEVPEEERLQRRQILATKAEERHEAALIRGLGPKAAGRVRRRDAEDRPGAGLDLGEISTDTAGSAASCSSHRTVITVHSGSESWQLEVGESATAHEVKRQIWKRFGVPIELQRLQCTPDREDECLDDSIPVVEVLGAQGQAVVLYLLPTENDPTAPRHGIEARLRDTEYDLYVLRPEDAGGRAAGRKVHLRLGALTSVLEAQVAAEVALLDDVGVEPACLSFAGRPLAHHLTLHQAGVGHGDTLLLAHRVLEDFEDAYESDSDADSFDEAMQRWA